MEKITMDQEDVNCVVYIPLSGFKWPTKKFSLAIAMLGYEWVREWRYVTKTFRYWPNFDRCFPVILIVSFRSILLLDTPLSSLLLGFLACSH